MLFDLRFAFRQLVKTPAFALVAVATLALGIGTCTAMFSVLNAVLLKPLPFREPERLVWIENNGGEGLSGATTRADTFSGWREQNKSFESLAAYFAFFDYGRLTLTGTGEPERLRGVQISDNLLPTLGVPLLHGRNFTAEECQFHGEGAVFSTPAAVIITYNFWHRRFSGDPAIVGRTVTINGSPSTIVGILPPSFDFASIFSPGNEIQLLLPFPLAAETAAYGNTLFGIGRLRPGVGVRQAQAELTVICTRLQNSTLQGVGPFGAVVRPLDQALRGRFRGAFLVLAGAVGCVLLISCVNLSNLLLSRLNNRRQEFGVRVALGARPWHLIRQTLIESLLLAVGGSVIGCLLAFFATHALARLQTFGVPLLDGAAIDPLALAVTVGLTLLAGVGCGLLPALQLLGNRRDLALQHATHQRTAGRSAARTRDGMIVAEVALACVLLVGAALLLKSFDSLLQVNLGFQPRHAMAWRMDPPNSFKDGTDRIRYVEEEVERIAALPGVEAAGLSDTLPLGRNRSWDSGAVGGQYAEGKMPSAFPRMIDYHYLRAMQIPLLEGRFFDPRDTANSPKVIIINKSLARQLWPDRSALGQKMAVNGESTVIGVVADVRHSSLEAAGGNEMYLDIHQSGDWGGIEMVVRSPLPAAALVPEVRAALTAYDPGMPNGEFYELEHLIDDAVAPRRLITQLLGFFSTLALTLSALGLYGVIAYSVGQRTQEIGIRMAVGAQRADVLKLVLQGGLRLVAIGVGLGLLGSLALTHLLQSLLFGVTAHDPLVFTGIATLLVAVGVVACLLPALRATRIDPISALRAE